MRFLPLPPGTTPFVVSAVIILFTWVIWGSLNYPEALWAPGDLSRFHSDITACTDCHRPFYGATPDNCIACHNEKDFAARSKPQVTGFHQQSIRERKNCSECHTEHRGALAQITIGALLNPHGEFVFRATGTNSCSACHDISGGFQSHLKLLDNDIVRHLMAEGDEAHKPGKMLHCLSCHEGGRVEVKED
jgi:Class III cytochrome C family